MKKGASGHTVHTVHRLSRTLCRFFTRPPSENGEPDRLPRTLLPAAPLALAVFLLLASAIGPVSPVQAAGAWIIAKTHSGNFTQGQIAATYAITVTNGSNGSSSGTVTVVDTLPASLTATAMSGTGWACTLGTLTCTRSDSLPKNQNYPPITLTVNVANDAPASVTNTAAASGGGITGSNASDPTTIIQLADLTIAKTHDGNFNQGQVGASYTITVTNSGNGSTSGTVTVTDTLPASLTATAMSGTGWTCTLGTLICTRSTTLAPGASYPPIALTVTVAINAPASVTNTATVSGGGQIITANDIANNPTTINQLPAITSADSTTFTVGSSGSFRVMATGSPAPMFSSTSLPSGVTLNATTGVLGGIPAAGTGGVYTITLTAHNVAGDATQDFALTVNEAAQFTSSNSTTFTTETVGTFSITTRGYPKPSIGQSGTMPSGMTFTANGDGTATLAGTPAAGTGGSYPLTFTASNGIGSDASQPFTLIVNQPPAITSVASAIFTAGSPGSFTMTATGYPSPTFSLTTLPNGLSLNATTGVLSGTPALGTGGVHLITLTAQNGVGTDAAQAFSLTIEEAPAITSADSATFVVGMAGSFTITTSGYPTATISASGTLPTGVTFTDNENGTSTLAGTPDAGTAGIYHIDIAAHNGIGTGYVQGLTLTVNQLPAIIGANSTAFTVGIPGSFDVMATGYPTPTLSVTTGTLPNGVTLSSGGLLSGAPATGTGGVYTLTLTASNGALPNANQTFTLIVNEAAAITSLDHTSFVVGQAGSFNVTALGYPVPTLSESGALPSGVTFVDNGNGTATLAGTPALGTAGVYNIRFSAANGGAEDPTLNFTLTVNQTAVITSGNSMTFLVGSAGSFNVTATGYPTPTLSESGTLPSGVTFDSATGLLSGTPAAGTAGSYPITFRAHNGIGNDAIQSFALIVGQAPAITSGSSASFDTGTPNSFTVTTSGYPTATLSESGGLPTGVTFTDNHNGTATLGGTPSIGTGGTYHITIAASNGIGSDATLNFVLTINEAAAVITSPGSTTFRTGTFNSFTVTATGIPAPTLTTSTLPSGMTFVDNHDGTATLSGTPVSGSGGIYTIAITAHNGVGADATQNFMLTVNQPPAITSANNATFLVGSAGTFTVTGTGFPAITLGMSGTLPGGVTFNDNHDGTATLAGMPAPGAGGSYLLVFTASNGIPPDAPQTFTLSVNEAASITSGNSANLAVGNSGTFTVTATGYPVPTFSETGPLPSGVTFNATTGVLSGTPALGSGGVYSITLTAHNGIGTDATQDLTLTVNEAAQFTSGSGTTFTTNSAGSFSITTYGYPKPSLIQSGTLPSGVAFTDNGNGTATLAGTPAADAGGSYPLTLTAHNSSGSDATQTLTLIVNQPPAFTNVGSTAFTAGSPGSFTVTATGYPAPTFSSTGTRPSGVTLSSGGLLSGTPAAGSGGVYTLTLTASNGTLPNASQTFVLTVDEAATIRGANSVNFTVGAAGSFSVTTYGYPKPTLSESGPLPSAVTFVDNGNGTGTIAGTPAAGTGNSYPITLTAHNGIGPDGSQNFTLVVIQPPVITSGNSALFVVGTANSFTMTATGYPAPTFSETGALPSGVTFNTSTGVLSGTAGLGTGGVYTVTITAANGGLPNATQTFILTINEAPGFTSGSGTTFTTSTAGSFSIVTRGYPKPSIMISGTLPSGVTFADNGNGTATLGGTPAAGAGGSYPLSFTAHNGIGTDASQPFTLIVNQPPAFTSANNTAFLFGTYGSFTVTATGYPAPGISKQGSGSLPMGVSLTDNGNGAATIAGTPSGAPGPYAITIRATNGVGGNVTQNFALTVNQLPAITSGSAVTFTVGTAGSFNVVTNGYPAPTLSESGLLPTGVTFITSTGLLSGTPAASSGGSYPITFTAENGVGAPAVQAFALTVSEALLFTGANTTSFNSGSAGSFTITTFGYPKPTLSKTGALPGGVTFADNLNGTATLAGTPVLGSGGTYTITVTAHNGVSTDATLTFRLTVNEAGAAITSANTAAFLVGSTGSFNVTTTGIPTPTIATTGALPGGVTFTDNGNGTATLTGTPSVGTGGSYPITFIAHNGVGADVSQSFTLIVNEAAAITSLNSAIFTTAAAGTFTITTRGYPKPSLAESGALPSGVTFIDNGNGTATLAGTPAAGTGGSYALSLTAHNSSGSDATQTLTLVVNQPPAFTSASSTTFVVGAAGSFTVTTTGYPAATLSMSGTLPLGVSFDAGTGVLSGTPQDDSAGVYPIIFSAQNGVLPNGSQVYTIAVHQAPAITSGDAATFTVGSADSFNVTATGYPVPTFSSTALPSGIALNAATGILSGTPSIGTGGTYSITLTAHNGVADATKILALTVNEAAEIKTADTTTFVVGAAGSFTVSATGYPAPILSESGALPGGVSFDASTGILSGMPAAGTAGPYSITFTAHNGIGADATQSFTLIVGQAPAITSASIVTFTIGTAGSFNVAATGYPAPTFTSTALPGGLTLNAAGVLSGMPADGTAGVHTATVYAQNGIGSDASQTLTITVTQAPTITSANAATFTVGTAGTFNVTKTGFPNPTMSLSGTLPSGLTFDAGSGLLSGTPGVGTGGTYNITLTAHNVAGDATRSFTLTVNEAAAITSVDHTTLIAGTPSTFSATATGYPAPTFSATTLPSGLALNATTGALEGTPTIGTEGIYSITLTAHNGIGLDATQPFVLTVNEAASITSANTTTFTTETAGSFTVTATGYPAPILSQSGPLPSGVTFNASTGVLGGTPATGTGGFYSFTFTAHNGIGSDATQSFALIVRQAPAITSGNAYTFTVGTADSFNVTATGYPAPTFSSTTLPNGLTLNATTGALSGTPAAGTGGTYSATLTAHNSVAEATQTLTLTVRQAAEITSAATTTFLVGTTGSFTVTASGYPTPTLSETGALPAGVTFNASTGVLSGTAAAGTGGTYSISFRANNGVGNDAVKSFTLTVNEQPSISSVNHVTFTVASAGSFNVTATGFPASIFSEAGALPAGITLSSGGLLSGTPAVGSTGIYTITLKAHNGVGADATQTFTLTVNEKAAITSLPSTSFVVGMPGYFHVTATGYPAPTLSQSGTLPSGVTFDAVSGNLSGTPAAGTGGVYSFTFTAQNGVGPDAVQNFTLTVGQAPAISGPTNATFVVGTHGSSSFTGTGYPAPAFSETGALPSGLTLSVYGELSGTPAVGTGGVYSIIVTASNGVPPNASQGLMLTVVESAGFTNVNNTAFLVGAAGSFTVTATGYPAPALSKTGTLPSGITFNEGTGVLSGTPAAGTAGVYPITFTAHNGIGSDAIQSFTLTVNQVPAITSANNISFIAGTASTFHVTATGYPVPTLGEIGALPGGNTFNPATGILGGTPAAGSGGIYGLSFTAHNGVGADAMQTFTLSVNEAPAITSANAISLTVGTTGQFHVTEIGFPDPTMSLSGTLPSGVTFDGVACLLSGTPAPGTGAAYPLVFTAHNGIGADASQSFTLTVNQAAAITSANNATFTVGSLGSFTVTGTGYPAPTFSKTGTLPTGVTLNAATGVIGGTPAAGAGGTYSLTLTAHNGAGADATQSFLLTVNEAAAITSANNATFTIGANGSFNVTAMGFPAPTLSKTGTLPAGVTFTDNGNGTATLAGTPAAGTGGIYSITISAHDGVGADATQSLTLTVNQGLVITSANAATFTAGTAGSFTVMASGYPAPTFSSTPLPAGLTLDTTSGALSGTPAAGTGGTYSITFTAHNGVGADATQNFTLTVNEGAVITSANSATFTVGTASSFNLTATGYPTPTKSLSGTLPGGITFNASSSLLSGTPTAGAGGIWLLTFTAHNGIGGDATQNLTLTVNEAPVLTTHPSNLTVNLGQTATFTSTASGMPVPTIQWAVSTDGGSTWNNIPGATGPTLSFTAQDTQHGSLYHAVYTNLAGSSTSTPAMLTVNTPPLITTAPISQTACAGSSVSFTTAAAGRPAPTVQWQFSTDGGAHWTDIIGATSLTLSVVANVTSNGYQYRAVFTNVAGSQTTAAATLHVNTTPTVTTQPASQTAVHGQSVTFTAAVNGNPVPTIQWQVSTNSGATWANISGAISTTLTLTVSRTDTGKQYRAVFNNMCSTAPTAAATLTVNKMDTTTALVSSANPSAPGKPVTLTATVRAKAPGSGTPTGTITFKDGATVLGVKNIDANGVATLTVSSISAGHHSITAQYGGDANSTGSVSLVVDQVGSNPSLYLPLIVR